MILSLVVVLFGLYGIFLWFMCDVLGRTCIREGPDFLLMHILILVGAGFAFDALFRHRPMRGMSETDDCHPTTED